MNQDPAFLFYSSDFLTECSDLTMEERGQYITLICLQHQKGHLSNKIIKLSVGNISDDVIKNFSQDENGFFYNKRVEELIEKRKKFSESRKANGSLGGRPKKPSGKPSGKPSENLPENENINRIINKLENILYNYHNRKFETKNWADSIDKMLRIDKVPFNDVIKNLNWYSEHIGEKYIPVIESGKSLREKYTKLENAVKREKPTTEYIPQDWSWLDDRN